MIDRSDKRLLWILKSPTDVPMDICHVIWTYVIWTYGHLSSKRLLVPQPSGPPTMVAAVFGFNGRGPNVNAFHLYGNRFDIQVHPCLDYTLMDYSRLDYS